eukprot:CAMPEP_0181387460 /NCGR_PEP_ID=MMETSP1106-20121128/23734_1 /TAXON_ID=81844 /ORGANISM="Mantoniella antarctica, Strain SL-175" /LENGTH=112 /DNA_ID=CAMNT_0023507847 /DNA_START=330 /DNA_END=665 /DNA_ORIENTATION=+
MLYKSALSAPLDLDNEIFGLIQRHAHFPPGVPAAPPPPVVARDRFEGDDGDALKASAFSFPLHACFAAASISARNRDSHSAWLCISSRSSSAILFHASTVRKNVCDTVTEAP